MFSPELRAAYRIRDVILDVVAYELRRDGRPIRLERQPMDLLLLLVERRGQLVTRAQIVDALWGKDVFVDVETGVHTAIRKIRQALRDPAEAPIFVETVPGKGYRFIAPVELLPGAATAASPGDSAQVAVPIPEPVPKGPTAATPPPQSSDVARDVSSPTPPESTATGSWASRHGPTLALAVLVVAAAALGWAWRHPGPSASAARVTMAVLPFENLSSDHAPDYLADGLTEDTIVSLGRIDPERVSVIGRTTMFGYRGKGKSLAEIGRDLGVDYIVEGSLRAEAGRLRITSRLVRAADQVQVWSDSFDRDGGSTLGVQQELSRAIAEQVRITLSPARADALARRHTRNEAAYDAFLRGRNFFYQRTPTAMPQAIAAFERAVALDPEYALAWAGLSIAHLGRTINGDANPREVWPIAREAMMRAARLDPDLAEAQQANGHLSWLLDWRWQEAEAAHRRALALDPSYALAHLTLGHLLSQSGRHDEAAAETRRARELEPFDPATWALSSQIAFQARESAAALAHARRAIALNPNFWFGYQMLGQALAQSGQYDGSLEALSAAVRLSERNSKPVSLRGYVLARTGRREEARAVLASLEEASRERYVPPYAMALVYAGLGDDAGVFDWLERAYAAHDVHLIFLPVDPKWDGYRSDPRFASILTRCRFTSP